MNDPQRPEPIPHDSTHRSESDCFQTNCERYARPTTDGFRPRADGSIGSSILSPDQRDARPGRTPADDLRHKLRAFARRLADLDKPLGTRGGPGKDHPLYVEFRDEVLPLAWTNVTAWDRLSRLEDYVRELAALDPWDGEPPTRADDFGRLARIVAGLGDTAREFFPGLYPVARDLERDGAAEPGPEPIG